MKRTLVTLGCVLALAGGSALAQSSDAGSNSSGPTLTEKVKDTARAIGDKTKEVVEKVKDKVGTAVNKAGDKTAEVGHKVGDKTREIGHKAGDKVEDVKTTTMGAGKDKQ